MAGIILYYLYYTILSILHYTIYITLYYLYYRYTHPNAIKITTTYGLLASVFGIPFPFISNYYIAIILLWLVLFFGGALMPCIIGIMISSVPKYLRTFANSSAQTFQNLFGYAPAPLLYGVVCDLTG